MSYNMFTTSIIILVFTFLQIQSLRLLPNGDCIYNSRLGLQKVTSRSSRLFIINSDSVGDQNDIIVGGLMKFVPISKLSTDMVTNIDPKILDTSSTSSDAQNALILAGISAFLLYEKRPRGSSRIDLIDTRRSSIPNANYGVFAKTFIPKETVLGDYPGYIRNNDLARESKLNSEALKASSKYMWSISNNNVLDPTNRQGQLELELTYLGGLVKVNTILARINEPPIGKDTNVYSRVVGDSIQLIAERDIFAEEELFVDYGSKFDRSDYMDNKEALLNQEKEKLELERLRKESGRFQSIVADPDSADIADQDTSRRGGFLDKLVKSEDNSKAAGILSPEDAARQFSEIGTDMFASSEDKDIIEGLTGKGTISENLKENRATSPSNKNEKAIEEYFKQSEDDFRIDDDDDDDDISSFDFDANLSEAATIFGDVTKNIATIESFDSKANDVLVKPQETLLSPEEAMSLQNSIDNMTEEQIVKVFANLKNTLNNQMAVELNEAIEKRKLPIKSSKKFPKVEPINQNLKKDYEKEFEDFEKELEKMYEDPLAVWDKLLNNADDYLSDQDMEEIARLQEILDKNKKL